MKYFVFFSYFFLETFADTYWNRLVTAIPTSIHKTRFKHQIVKLAGIFAASRQSSLDTCTEI